MKPLIRSITFLVATSLFFTGVVEVSGVGEGDRINMAVSPIRDEFTVSTGGTTTRQVTFYNNADVSYNVYITTEDCEPGSNYGTPICHPATSTGIDSTKSSTWITPEVSGIFTIGPNSSRVLSFTVNVPDNAGPGGHYGAIFFNNPTGSITGNAVNMNRRIGMLYLMTVRGQIIVNTNLGDILIDAGGGGAGNSSSTPLSIMTLFSAPSSFFAEGYKRFMMVFDDPEQTADIINEISPIWEKPVIRDDNFLVSLKVPVENTGNTHIKPTGKIYLYDGETRLEKIGKQSIVDDNGVYFGEKIVDFLPINDEGGNVLPNTERTFTIDWAGFAFNDIDPVTGKRIVGFESPSNYYSRTAGSDAQFLLPWERLSARTIEKELQAKVEVTYINPITGLNEVYTLELPVPIHYTFIAKTINWSALILILLILLLFWIIRNRNKKIHVLEDETHHLEDEIHVLERAQKAHSLKKKETPSAPKKEEVKKVPVKKTASVKKEAKPTPPPTEKKPVKKVTKKPAKPRVKKETPPSLPETK